VPARADACAPAAAALPPPRRCQQLDVFQHSFSWLTVVLPYLVVAHRYFSGEIEYGVIAQTAMAFRVIQVSSRGFAALNHASLHRVTPAVSLLRYHYFSHTGEFTWVR
jgi:hypothetical protein